MALVCDTGPLLAALDRGDLQHGACEALIATCREALVIPGLVLAELDYWCRKRDLGDSWLTFLDDIDLGRWRVEHATAGDLRRARELQAGYRDLDIGVVDATVLAVVERLEEPKLATLDRRHFTALRPSHVGHLTLLPEALVSG